MNRDAVLNYLLTYLSQFSYHENFLVELINLIAKSGYERRFFTLLVSRLHQLSTLGTQAVNLIEFEPINERIFSMHLSQKDFNIRFLYSFLPNSEPVFLIPFYERAGKRKTDYTPYIPAAEARLEEMIKEFNNEY